MFKSLYQEGVRIFIEKLNQNHATQELVFSGLVVRGQVDEEARKDDFRGFLEQLIQLVAMSVAVLKKNCYEEGLVTESNPC